MVADTTLVLDIEPCAIYGTDTLKIDIGGSIN